MILRRKLVKQGLIDTFLFCKLSFDRYLKNDVIVIPLVEILGYT